MHGIKDHEHHHDFGGDIYNLHKNASHKTMILENIIAYGSF